MSYSATHDAVTAKGARRDVAASSLADHGGRTGHDREGDTAAVARPVLRIVPQDAPDHRPPAEWFEPQPTTTADLPDPEPLIGNLALCVVEAMAGVRDIEQVARWVTADVFRALMVRVQHAARARTARRRSARRPNVHVQLTTLQSPAEGTIEAVVVMDVGPRVLAIAIRLEGFDRRWRATSLNIL